MAYVHIHAPQPTERAITATVCLDCGKRTRMVQFFTPYYGWDSTCLRCGRHWRDGEWTALAFMRGARKNSIDRAKRRWRNQ